MRFAPGDTLQDLSHFGRLFFFKMQIACLDLAQRMFDNFLLVVGIINREVWNDPETAQEIRLVPEHACANAMEGGERHSFCSARPDQEFQTSTHLPRRLIRKSYRQNL